MKTCMEQQKEYYAFISYKREDEKWAKWLQNKLEHYKFPTNLNGRTDLPKNIRPTFRDVTDLKPGLLAEEINNALCNSEWLIVVCSPRSAKSPWVCKEAQTFIDLGRADHIIPFVIEGNPFSADAATECYPEALLNLTGSKELLAANINEMGRDAAAIKVVARMFNLRFDALWQRYEREKKKQRIIIRSTIIAITLIAFGIAGWMIHSDWKMMKIQARAVAEKASNLIDEGDSYTARRILLEVVPKDWAWKLWPNRPYVPEVEAVLRRASKGLSGRIKTTSHVRAICFMPDGQTFLTAADGGEVIFWDRNEFVPIDTLKADSAFVFNIQVDRSGTRLMTSNGQDVKIWDVRTRELKQTIHPHRGFITTAAFSPDGKRIVISAIDNNYGSKFLICVWSAETGDSLRTIRNSHYGNCWAEFCRNGQCVVGGDSSALVKFKRHSLFGEITIPGTVTRFWDATTGEILRTINIAGSFNCYSEQVGKLLYNAGDSVVVYDIHGNRVCVLQGQEKPIVKACFNPTGDEVMTATDNGTIVIWDAQTGDVKYMLKGHSSGITDAVYSPDGQCIVSAAGDYSVRIWDIRMADPDMTLGRKDGLDNHYKTRISCNNKTYIDTVFFINQNILYSPKGTFLAASASDGHIRIWNARTGTFYKSLRKTIYDSAPWLMAFDRDEKLLASSDGSSERIWDCDSSIIRYERKLTKGLPYIQSLSFSPDSRKLLATNDSVTCWMN